jgi:hypothetical protein
MNMKEIPIVVLWTEGAVFHSIECEKKAAAILVLDCDIASMDDSFYPTTVCFGPKDRETSTQYQVMLMMDDHKVSIGEDETLSFDEVMARARISVNAWADLT